MKQIIQEQQNPWEQASKDAAASQTGTTPTVTKPKTGSGTTNKGGGTTNKGGGTTNKGGGTTNKGGGTAADKLKKPETRVVAEASTIQAYIRAAYFFFEKIGPMTTNVNLDETAIHTQLINYLGVKSQNKANTILKARYLDLIIRISNPNSAVSGLIKKYPAAWNYVIKGSKGITIQAIRAIPCLSSLKTFNDFINPKSQLGDWLDAHDFNNMHVRALIRSLTGANIITYTESSSGENIEILQTTYTGAKTPQFWQTKVLTLYKNKAYG